MKLFLATVFILSVAASILVPLTAYLWDRRKEKDRPTLEDFIEQQ